MMKPIAVITLIALSPASTAAFARASIDARQAHQRARIAQGIGSGAVTWPEMRRLAAEQRGIRVEERAYRADGQLTAWERADLQRDLSAASRHMWWEKHDAQKRF